jgi:hypothetical protein
MIRLKRLLLFEYLQSPKEDINAAIADVVKLGIINPINRREVIINDTVIVEITNFDGHMWMNSILSMDRHIGKASEVMKQICDIADNHNVGMALEAKAFGANNTKDKLTTSQLVNWYRKFGFKPIGYGTMERVPSNMKGINI